MSLCYINGSQIWKVSNTFSRKWPSCKHPPIHMSNTRQIYCRCTAISFVQFSWRLRAQHVAELQTPTKLQKKKSARFRLDKISDLQGVFKDFTVISALYMKIWIFGLSRSKKIVLYLFGETPLMQVYRKCLWPGHNKICFYVLKHLVCLS
jgi:hypothetical protein